MSRKSERDGSNVTPLRPPSRKGIPATAKQRASLAKGTQAQKDRAAARKAAGKKSKIEGGRTRMDMLLKGEITVRDLDNEELIRMQTRDVNGLFGGQPPAISGKLVQQMKQESIRRAQATIDSSVGAAVELLKDVVGNREVSVKDRLKAAELLMARGMGSVPQHVVQHEGSKWDDMIEDSNDPVVVFGEQEEGTGA